MNTRAETLTCLMLRDALDVVPREMRRNWLLSLLGDLMTGDELEDLGNHISRAGHLKSRVR